MDNLIASTIDTSTAFNSISFAATHSANKTFRFSFFQMERNLFRHKTLLMT